MTHFIITYHISLVKVQINYCNNNLLILDLKQLNKIIKLYYFHTLKALWDDQGKIEMYYGMSRVKKQLLRKTSIEPTFIHTFSLKRGAIKKVFKSIGFFFSVKFAIVHFSTINPCQYSVVVL